MGLVLGNQVFYIHSAWLFESERLINDSGIFSAAFVATADTYNIAKTTLNKDDASAYVKMKELLIKGIPYID